ncbi:MAG: hypothetical protein B7Z15_06255 [Rhizobiales bacterium 32-66-8]|nr:MAG: hypothetical protein B7Z15_06255 [Rhizobiales bacterium 32-66-8]
MRVRIRHEVTHNLDPGMRSATVCIRVTPRNHQGQHILRWSLDVLPDCRLYTNEDAFGNLTRTFSVDGPLEAITVLAEGEVDTIDTNGIVTGTVERFPPSLFLRQTWLTEPTPGLSALAERIRAEAGDELGRLHALMTVLNEEMTESPLGTAAVRTAGVALEAGEATSAEMAQIFTSAARQLGIPARQISGYAAVEGETGSARQWAEAFVPKIGWVGFDCGPALCPTDSYVRLCAGLDALCVSTIRGMGSSTLEAADATDAFAGRRSQSQSQSQS